LLEVQTSARVVDFAKSESKTLTAAQKRGLSYQAKVEKELGVLYPGLLVLRPWFRYKIDYRVQHCQPDAFLQHEDRIVLIEVKYATENKSWEQLQLYKKVVLRAYRCEVSLVLVTRMFDPHVKFPVKVTQLEGLDRVGGWRGEGLAVVSWRPR
jgi:hypothetical protein